MDKQSAVPVVGRGGLRGTVTHVPASGTADVELDSGQRLVVPVSMLELMPDGTYSTTLGLEDVNLARTGSQTVVASSPSSGQSVTVPVVEEQVHLEKEKQETGRVTIHIVPQVRTEHLHVPLTEEHVQIERVPVNEFVTAPSPVREEGDTTIVPVYDEVVVVERRLMLREEIHIRRERITREEDQEIPLRTEEVHIMRTEPPQDFPPAAAI